MIKKTIQSKFLLSILLTTLVLLFLSGFLSYNVRVKKAKEYLIKKDATLTELASLAVREPIYNFDNETLKLIVDALFKDVEVALVKVLSEDGTELINKTREDKIYKKAKILESSQKIMKEGSLVGTINLGISDHVQSLSLKRELNYLIFQGLILILILGIIVIFSTNKIIKPLKIFVKQFDKGVHGDLTVNVDVNTEDEIGDLGLNFNLFISKLAEIISNIKVGAIQIAESSNEINKANEELAEKTTEQASSLEETSATMQEMSSLILSNTEETLEASKLTQQTKVKTEMVGKSSINLKNSMQEIAESSKKIENIIGVIDEIAFQTNLLALNAAVEAARAGEQGRGFAVVAVEVRNLAGRSSKAAKEIKELIGESVDRVDQGTKLVEGTIESLDEIISEVKQVNDVISKIATSAKEQEKGIEQANNAISEIDRITQTNAGIAQETSASSNVLYKQANDFLEIIKFFQLGESYIVGNEVYGSSNQKSIKKSVSKKSLKEFIDFEEYEPKETNNKNFNDRDIEDI